MTEQGNFDLVVENDDLDKAVDTLSRRLMEWFPSIKAAAAVEGEGQGEYH